MSGNTNELTPDQHLLIEKLRLLNGSAGNKTLREKLRWGERKYLGVQADLVDLGLLERGRGRGGSVSLTTAVAESAPTEAFTEAALYSPACEALPNWILQHYGPKTFTWLTSEVVGAKGGTAVGGTWRRTDLAAISVRAFEYSPDLAVDSFAFEMKTIQNLDVPAIYETAENSEGATYAYLLVHQSARADRASQSAKFLRIEKAATLLGVGIITFDDPRDVESWSCELDAVRRPHNPPAADSFVFRTFSSNLRDELSEKIRRTDGPAAYHAAHQTAAPTA